MNFEHRWSSELLDWIDETELNFGALSSNPSAICYLEKNPDKIVWNMLSLNPLAIHLLEQNPDKICWNLLSKNLNAIHLLEKNRDKIVFLSLSHNTNPKTISLIQEYLDDDQKFEKKILTEVSQNNSFIRVNFKYLFLYFSSNIDWDIDKNAQNKRYRCYF